MRPIGTHNYFVYIITNKNKTALYVGVTNNLEVRLHQHSENEALNIKNISDLCIMPDDMSGFSKKTQLEPEDYYTTPEGYIVFTEHYLLKRGYCCKSGCRHCPYGFDPKTNRLT